MFFHWREEFELAVGVDACSGIWALFSGKGLVNCA